MITLRHPLLLLTTALLLLLLLTAATSTAQTTTSPAPSPSNEEGDQDFVQASCQTTLYPARCYQTLSRYSAAVRQDPARLSIASVAVTLSHASSAAVHVTSLSSDDPRATSALRDCKSVLRDAVGQIRGSLKQMKELFSDGSGEEARFKANNVQTWMSAALTNEDTCVDGFDDVADDLAVKADVRNVTVVVKEVTSNALALVNSYVNKVIIP